MSKRTKKKVKKAKICVRTGRKLKCKQITIKTNVWKEGAFSSAKKLLEEAAKMAKKDGYATVIRRLNLIRIWNKNRNRELSKRIEKVMEKLRKMHARGEV